MSEQVARFTTVVEWFAKSRDSALAMGKMDSAALWADGLQHLLSMEQQRDELLHMLKLAGDIIGHPEDAFVMHMNSVIAKAEANHG